MDPRRGREKEILHEKTKAAGEPSGPRKQRIKGGNGEEVIRIIR